MDQRKDVESRQDVLDFKCKKIIHGVEKSTALSTAPLQNLGSKITLQTPEKTNEFPQTKLKEGEAKVPEKYKTIAEFFDCMSCSLRLLSLRKKSPTFQNICRQVEVLRKRKFSYGHLAQMKYILPEAMQIDKILVHDEKTLCMKPDVKITLLLDVVEGHGEQSGFMALRQVFACRLLKFFTTHPEAYDIPEALLPEPFGRPTKITVPEESPVDSTESQPTSVKDELFLESSHLCPSFSRHFSREVTETESIQSLASSIRLSSAKSDAPNNEDVLTSPQKEYPCLHSKYDGLANQDVRDEQHKEFPAQLTQHSAGFIPSESPVVKLALSAYNIMIETPAQLTPKRLLTSCEDKVNTVTSQNRMSNNRKPTKRSLNFSRFEDDTGVLNSISDESECNKTFHDSIPQNLEMKEILEKDNYTASLALQKIEECLGCPSKDHKIRQTGVICPQLSASLLDLVAQIHHIFKSINRSSVTKEELVHKIIMNNCDMTERSEAEEQIELLEKLVPDWICRKLAPSGDIFYTIKKVSDLGTVQAKLIM